VAAALLVATAISSFLCLDYPERKQNEIVSVQSQDEDFANQSTSKIPFTHPTQIRRILSEY
jgi:hypothetical protein